MQNTMFTATATALLILSLFTHPAFAWRCGSVGGNCEREPSFYWPWDIPHLGSEQSATLSELQKNFIKETSPLRDELALKNIELCQLLAQPQPASEEVTAKQKEITSLRSQLEQKYLNNQLAVRKIIPEEQWSHLPYYGGPHAHPSSDYFPGWMRGCRSPSGQGSRLGIVGSCDHWCEGRPWCW